MNCHKTYKAGCISCQKMQREKVNRWRHSHPLEYRKHYRQQWKRQKEKYRDYARQQRARQRAKALAYVAEM